MGSDTLRPPRAYPLKLTQASLRQAQGTDDPAPVSLHASFLHIPLLHQPCNKAAIIVIIPRQLPHQRHRHLSTQAHKLHQLHCHTSILQLHLYILLTNSRSDSTPNRLTAANTKRCLPGCPAFTPATLNCHAPFYQAACLRYLPIIKILTNSIPPPTVFSSGSPCAPTDWLFHTTPKICKGFSTEIGMYFLAYSYIFSVVLFQHSG